MSTADHNANGPFEGPEKLLEIWFAPSPADVPSAIDGKRGLRKVPRLVWEEMLDIVKCKILSVVEGAEMDGYLLRYVSSATFIYPSITLPFIRMTCSCLLEAITGRDLRVGVRSHEPRI